MSRTLYDIVSEIQQGYDEGKSLYDDDMISLAEELLGQRIDELAEVLEAAQDDTDG